MRYKKIIILIGVLLLSGVGCVGARKQTGNLSEQKQIETQNNTVAPEEPAEEITLPNLSQTQLDELNIIFTSTSQSVGFRAYYPTYIPDEVALDKNSITVSDNTDLGKVLTFNLGGAPNSDLPWILIQEQKNNSESEYILNENEKMIDGLNGYAFSNTNSAGEFNNAVFSTDDGIMIKLTSKYFTLEDLMKVAKLMKNSY